MEGNGAGDKPQVRTPDDLRAHFGQLSPLAEKKVLHHLDKFCRDFIALSPFLVLASSDGKGNADASRKGIVPADLVRQLSYDRADAVRKEIIAKYRFDPEKFKVIGNGWDNPVPGMTDSSNVEHNRRNRRVEIKVFPLEKE